MTTITVHTDHPGARINPAMWGLFFEDINFGADGGLYAELIKNRAFAFPDPLMGWHKLSPSKARGTLSVESDAPFAPTHPTYIRLQSEGTDVFGIANEGFRGIGVKAGEAYDLAVRLRCQAGTPSLKLALYGGNGALLAEATLDGLATAWDLRKAELAPTASDAKAKLYLLVAGAGTVDVDFVSLFPRHTWKQRPGGLRADMVQALADLKPGFLRFPGGCIVEGSELDKRYQWKKTIGPVEDRPLLINRWNYEFLHRPTPDYYQSFGLGFFEYFLLCEDIGAAPLPILNCGMACQFNSGELAPLAELDPYIQDALDLIAFANGPVSSEWGAKRAALGHPEPFRLTMLGIGNEQWGPQYIERLERFVTAIRATYPEIKLIASAGPEPADERFAYLWPEFRKLNIDIVDEHCYARPDWFYANAHRYDAYDRAGPKVFFGEYAAQSDKMVSVANRNTLECALSEAAYMTGLERNADVVVMASYAPLFAHKDAWQWTPDLVWVDNLTLVRTANYYVQQLFATHRGEVVLPFDVGDPSDTLFVSTVADADGEVIVKLVNSAPVLREVTIRLADATIAGGRRTVLSAASLDDYNRFETPDTVAPVSEPMTVASGRLTMTLPANAFVVVRLQPQA